MRHLPSLYRGLAALHRAGVGWPEAFATAAQGQPSLVEATALVTAGRPVSEALAGRVPGLHLALVRAGEASGRLEQSFEDLAERLDEDRRRRGQRRAALAYPILLAHISAVLLPISDLARGNWGTALLWALVPLVPVYTLLFLSRWTPGGDGPIPCRFPWRSRVEELDASALDALGALYDAGVPILEALPLAAAAGPRGRAAADLTRAVPRVREGLDLAGAWSALPREVTHGLTIAERAGSLGKECRAAAERLEFEVEMRRKRGSARLGPMLMLVLGLIIAARVVLFWQWYLRVALH